MTTLPTGGAVRPIVRWGEPILHRALAPVTAYDDDLAALVADMFATMYAAEGVGLAANQIGVDLAVFVFDCPDDTGVRHRGVVCNPEVYVAQGKDRRLDEDDEGCLSLPGVLVEVERPVQVRVRAQDERGERFSVEASGLEARVIQHEMDHLDGVLILDRTSRDQRKQAMRALREALDARSAA